MVGACYPSGRPPPRIMRPMHLLIPFAAPLSEGGARALGELALPNLQGALARLEPTLRLGTDEYSLTPPHESALAAAWGWRGAEGLLPFAALAAQRDGIAVLDLAWALLTPVHWNVGRDQVTMADPDALALDEAESRALFDAARGLFESEGFVLAWGAPSRWYAAHQSLAELPCASPDRVVGRSVDRWLPAGANARLLRRLQSEVQMLWHAHPVNREREAQGRLVANSVWVSGCGRHQPADAAAVRQETALREPLLREDWAAWSAAWRALDAGPVAELAQRAARGEGVALTLSGERFAQRFEARRAGWLQRWGARWRRPDVPALLGSL